MALAPPEARTNAEMILPAGCAVQSRGATAAASIAAKMQHANRMGLCKLPARIIAPRLLEIRGIRKAAHRLPYQDIRAGDGMVHFLLRDFAQ